MALPVGFDPEGGTFKNVKPIIQIPRNDDAVVSSVTAQRSYRRTSWWKSLWSFFDDGVACIGNWFVDNIETVIGICCAIVIFGGGAAAIISVIITWIDSGFWAALLQAIITGIVGYLTIGISWYVINVVVNVLMWILRFIFWNGWSLLATLIAAAGIWIYAANSAPSYDYSQESQVETVTPVTQTYRCTATVLNIRSAPNQNSNVMGALRKGEEVEVYGIYNDFAQIYYNGQIGYVSTKYLTSIHG